MNIVYLITDKEDRDEIKQTQEPVKPHPDQREDTKELVMDFCPRPQQTLPADETFNFRCHSLRSFRLCFESSISINPNPRNKEIRNASSVLGCPSEPQLEGETWGCWVCHHQCINHDCTGSFLRNRLLLSTCVQKLYLRNTKTLCFCGFLLHTALPVFLVLFILYVNILYSTFVQFLHLSYLVYKWFKS